jgi:hypothetical protein
MPRGRVQVDEEELEVKPVAGELNKGRRLLQMRLE